MDGRSILLMLISAAAGSLATLVMLQIQPSDNVSASLMSADAVEAVTPAPSAPKFREAQIRRASDGYFWARAAVNGTDMKFLVDTGASTTALTYDDAKRLDLDPDSLDFKWKISTAGGETRGASVLLESIRVGDVEIRNVEAMVLGEELEQSLLGMSFLGELYSYEFQDRSLIIRQ